MQEIWLVRHAPVAVKGLCYGQSDVPCLLGPTEAAEQVASQLQPFREVWASPWARAREVAQRLATHWGATLHLDARLSEMSFGEWEGRPFSELEQADPVRFSAWMADWKTLSPPGGEALADFLARTGAWLEERRKQPSGALLAVTHAGVIRMLRAHARGLSPEAALAEPVEPLRPERLSPTVPGKRLNSERLPPPESA